MLNRGLKVQSLVSVWNLACSDGQAAIYRFVRRIGTDKRVVFSNSCKWVGSHSCAGLSRLRAIYFLRLVLGRRRVRFTRRPWWRAVRGVKGLR